MTTLASIFVTSMVSLFSSLFPTVSSLPSSLIFSFTFILFKWQFSLIIVTEFSLQSLIVTFTELLRCFAHCNPMIPEEKQNLRTLRQLILRRPLNFNIIYHLFKSLNTAFDSCLFVWKLMTPCLRKNIIVYPTLFLSMWCQLRISAASSYWILPKIWKKWTLPVAPKASKHSMGLRSPASTASAQNINCLEDNKGPQSVSWENIFTSLSLIISL